MARTLYTELCMVPQEYCCMITQLGHKLEPKAVAVWRALTGESGWEDKFWCSFLVVIWLVCFNNRVRSLESTPPILSVLHNEAPNIPTFTSFLTLITFLLQITSLPSCLSTWCLVLTLIRQTLHSLTVTYSSCTQCVSSSFPCDWCDDGYHCTHDMAENCRKDILVSVGVRVSVSSNDFYVTQTGEYKLVFYDLKLTNITN
jgi:hypothetical protein